MIQMSKGTEEYGELFRADYGDVLKKVVRQHDRQTLFFNRAAAQYEILTGVILPTSISRDLWFC